MKIKRIIMFAMVLIVLIIGMGLISIKWTQKVEVETGTKTEINIIQDEALLDIITNDEPVPSDGSMTITGIFIKRSEKKN